MNAVDFAKMAVRQLKRAWIRLLPYQRDAVSREGFENMYSQQQYEYLRGVGELAHYSVIIGYCRHLKPAGALLDVGCGEGILRERLDAGHFSRYVGIDFSQEAIRRASRLEDDRTCFACADVLSYVPDGQFDTIVFGECLYYFDDPLSVLERYRSALKDDGIFIVSICDHERTSPVWKLVEAVYTALDSVRVTHQSKLSWTIKILAPARSAGT